MSGECDNCGEHALECCCKALCQCQQNSPGYSDDHLISKIVSECLEIMRGYPTITKMTACYNLTERILRLFSVQSTKENAIKLIEDFHSEIKQCVEEYYE